MGVGDGPTDHRSFAADFTPLGHQFLSRTRTDVPIGTRRKLHIVVDGQGMINERGGSAGAAAAVRFRCSRRAITVKYAVSPGSCRRVSRAPFSIARSTIAASRS